MTVNLIFKTVEYSNLLYFCTLARPEALLEIDANKNT